MRFRKSLEIPSGKNSHQWQIFHYPSAALDWAGNKTQQADGEVERELFDGSDSDEVSNRFGLKDDGSCVEAASHEMFGEQVEMGVKLWFVAVFCQKNSTNSNGLKTILPNQSICRLFDGGVNEGYVGSNHFLGVTEVAFRWCWQVGYVGAKRVQISNGMLSVAVDEFDVDVFWEWRCKMSCWNWIVKLIWRMKKFFWMKKLKVTWKRINWLELNCEIELWNWKYFEWRNLIVICKLTCKPNLLFAIKVWHFDSLMELNTPCIPSKKIPLEN